MTEAGYDCLRDALTIARGDHPPHSVKMLRKRLEQAGHGNAAIDEALSSWAGSVVTRLTRTPSSRVEDTG
mgnify:CR=1 FL=1